MKLNPSQFIPAASIAVRDADLQTAMTLGTNNAYDRRMITMFESGKAYGESLRQQAAAARRRALRQLPDLLEEAEANFTEKGITVLWAQNAAEAQAHILEIARRHEVKRIVKSKSMTTEEIHLNSVLEAGDIEVVETDLGEFIVQIADDAPSHIVMPVLHRTKAYIRDLFMEKLGMEYSDDAGFMTAFARKHLRERFLSADMGISGGNFVLAETGTLCLVSNEGNIDLVTTRPRVHVALVGIEKVIPTLEDYATLTQVLPRSATGQRITCYVQMVNAPRQPDEPDGPDHIYVVFMDNGRSDIYMGNYVEALACIRCGACLNACPVYRSIGGHPYGSVYSGPIGAVITPLLTGLENASSLPYASSLCGRCKEVCPVDIDLPRMLIELRQELVEKKMVAWYWRLGLRLWGITSESPRLFALAGKVTRFGRNRLFKKRLPGLLGGWTKYRDLPPIAPKTFHQLWEEREKRK